MIIFIIYLSKLTQMVQTHVEKICFFIYLFFKYIYKKCIIKYIANIDF